MCNIGFDYIVYIVYDTSWHSDHGPGCQTKLQGRSFTPAKQPGVRKETKTSILALDRILNNTLCI